MSLSDLASEINKAQAKKKETSLGGCLSMLVLICMSPLFAMNYGWAIWMYWGWFALPAWGTATWHQMVGMAALIGLASIGIIASRPKSDEDGSPAAAWHKVFVNQGAIVLSVGMGWIIHALGFGNH